MLRHEFTRLMDQGGYELFTKACARKAFLHEQENGPETSVIEFIESLEHENSDDIYEAYVQLKSDWVKANLYPSTICGEALTPFGLEKRWGIKC